MASNCWACTIMIDWVVAAGSSFILIIGSMTAQSMSKAVHESGWASTAAADVRGRHSQTCVTSQSLCAARSCYVWRTTPLQHAAAQADCASLGGSLAVYPTYEDQLAAERHFEGQGQWAHLDDFW